MRLPSPCAQRLSQLRVLIAEPYRRESTVDTVGAFTTFPVMDTLFISSCRSVASVVKEGPVLVKSLPNNFPCLLGPMLSGVSCFKRPCARLAWQWEVRQEHAWEGYHNLMGIYRELQAQGYRGSYENVRAQFVNTSPRHRSRQASPAPRTRIFPAKRLAAFLFLRRPEDLTLEEHESVSKLRHLDPEIDQAYLFVQQFVQMMRTRTGERLDAWLLAVGSSSLIDFHPFVKSISEDLAAVQAGLTREESNGPVEGQITRLKLIKRSMYGRANFDLLRIRVLSSAQKDLSTQEMKARSTRELRAGGENTSNFQLTTIRVIEVA